MPVCKHCDSDVTLAAGDGPICPACGKPFELSDEDWDFDELQADDGGEEDGGAPEETAKEADEDLVGEATEAFGGVAEDAPPQSPAPADSQNLAGREASIDMTHAFGGKFADDDDDDWDDVEEVALGSGDDEEEDATAGPGDMTAPFVDPSQMAGESTDFEVADGPDEGTVGSSLEGDLPSDKPADTDRVSPEATIAFAGDGTDAPSAADTGFQTGVEPTGSGTARPGEPIVLDSDQASSEAPSSDRPPSDFAGTLPAGLSGSDRPGSGSAPQTFGEDMDSGGGDSGTLAVDGDSDRRSDRVKTPEPREVTGLESNQTMPRGPLGDDQASQSLRPGDTHVVGPENVRLRAYRLGKDEARGPNDFLFEGKSFSGGMGIVHSTLQRSLDRRVAVKQVKAEMSANETDRNKFISEAVITGQLEHPNIIPVHDLGLASDGLPFYSMKFVEGDEWEKKIKVMSEEENLNILIQVAQAIAFAHSKDIIHRDLKPSNVMLGGYGEVLVMDWGLAARLDGSEIPPSGTPVYMPPETALQYLDYTKGRVGGKKSTTRRVPPGTYSDIYLLGGLLFKLVTGRAPHKGKTTFECLKAAARNEIVKTSKRGELLDIAYKALKTDPGDRHRDVNEFIDEIKAYQAHAQSNKIARQAWQDLRAAEKAKEDPNVDARVLYDNYNSARFGFRNALELWSGNRRAEKRLVEAKRKHAETAYTIGDYDLALTLLDPDKKDDAELITEVRDSQRQRDRKLSLFRTLQYAVAASLVVALGFIALSFYLRLDAIAQREAADIAKQEADEATLEAERQTEIANQKEAIAEEAVVAANTAREQLVLAKEDITKARSAEARAKEAAEVAVDAAKIARDEKTAALEIRDEAMKAKEEATLLASIQGYRALTNRLRATLADRGAYAAWKDQQEIDRDQLEQLLQHKGPEWEALEDQIEWQDEATEVFSGLDSPVVAVSDDGLTVVVGVGGPNGPRANVYRGGEFDAPAASFALPSRARRVVLSPDGSTLAAVGDETSSGELSLFRTEDGEPFRVSGELPGRVTAVAFDPAGGGLLTGDSRTGVAVWRLDVEAGVTELQQSPPSRQWHDAPITAVGYDPSSMLLFASDEMGSVSFWRKADFGKSPIAYRHSDQASSIANITAADLVVVGEKPLNSDEEDPRRARFAYGCVDGSVYVIDFLVKRAVEFAEARFVSYRVNEDTPTRLQIKPERLTTPHSEAVSDVRFAEGGALVVSAGGPRILVRDALPSIDLRRKKTRTYHAETVTSLAVTGDGDVFSSDKSDKEGRVVRWSVTTKSETVRLEPAAGESHGGVVTIGVDPASGAVAVGDRQGFVRRWESPFTSAAYDRRFAGHADHRRMRAWRLPGAEPRLVTVGADRYACVWDASSGELLRTIDLGGRGVVAPSADGSKLLAATDQRLVDANSAVAIALADADADPKPLWTNDPRVAAIHEFVRPGVSEPVMAIGLRDGQFYLWSPSRGRVDLVSPIVRPHWSQIRAIAYDAPTDTLFAADNDALLTRWPLGAGSLTTYEPGEAFLDGEGTVRRIEVSPRGELLVVRSRRDDARIDLIDAETLRPTTLDGFERSGLQDATFADGGRAVLAVDGSSNVLRWSASEGWRESGAGDAIARETKSRGAVTGIRAGDDGRVMLFGDGFAHLWTGVGATDELVCRVESRALPTATAPSAGSVVALSSKGRVDTWSQATGDGKTMAPTQVTLGETRSGVRACPAAETGRYFVATPTAGGGATVALTDLATSREFGDRFSIDSGKVIALQANADWLAVAVRERGKHRVEVFSIEGGERQTVSLAAAPTAVTVGPQGRRVAAALGDGSVAYAHAFDDGWRVSPLDGVTASAIAFTPAGDRLMVGALNGRVAMLEVTNPGEDKPASRVVLTFDGHSERVSVLQFATIAGDDALVSGDDSGAVLVRRL